MSLRSYLNLSHRGCYQISSLINSKTGKLYFRFLVAVALLSAAIYAYSALASAPVSLPFITNTNATQVPNASVALVSDQLFFASNFSSDVAAQEENSTFKWYKRTLYQPQNRSLVGYWKLDGNANDSGGYGNGGTLYGNARSNQSMNCKIDDCLTFDTNGYVNLTDLPESSAYTLEAWVKTSAAAGNDNAGSRAITIMRAPGSSRISLGQRMNSSVSVFSDGTNRFISLNGTTPINDSVWHHLAMTHDGTTAFLYVDGKLESSITATLSAGTTTISDAIGRSSTAQAGLFNGSIDEVAVYSYAKSASEIAADYANSPYSAMIYKDAIGYWHLDENGGTNGYADSSGSGNVGIPMGEIINTTGIIGGALVFNASPSANRSVNILDSPTIRDVFAVNGTISAWIYPLSNGTNGFGRIADKSGTSTAAGWSWLMINTSNPIALRFIRGSTGTLYSFTTSSPNNRPVVPNRWNHVALTYSDASPSTPPKMYVNGVEVAVTTQGGSGSVVSDVGLNLTIGNRADGTRMFNGSIDEVAIYNRSLSASEVKQLYLRSWYDYSPQLFLLHPDNGLNASGLSDFNTTDLERPTAISDAVLQPGRYASELVSDVNTTLLMHFSNGSDLSGLNTQSNISYASYVNDSVSGLALRFNGTHSVVNFTGNNFDYGLGDNMSYEFWMKASTLPSASAAVLSKRQGTTAGYRITLQSTGDLLAIWDANTVGNKQMRYRIALNKWYHVAFVRDAKVGFRLYINGNLTNTTADDSSTSAANTDPLSLGFSTNSETPDYFNGMLDEVKVLNRNISDAEVLADYRKAATGLGLLSNAYINYSAVGNFNEREGTVEFWVKPEWNGTDGLAHNFFVYGKVANDFTIQKRGPGALGVFISNPSGYIIQSSSASSWLSGDWHYVAATWNNYTSNMTLHIDGVQVNNTGSAFSITSFSRFGLGDSGSSNTFYGNATISEFRISRKALSAQEINFSFSKSRPIFQNEYMLNSSNYIRSDSFKVEYLSKDSTGTAGASVNTSFITIVNTPPVAVNISLPAGGSTVVADFVNITWNASFDAVDNDSIVSYFVVVNGTTVCTTTGLNCTFIPYANGFYLFNVTAFDNGGDNSTPSNSTFIFSDIAPNATFSPPNPAHGVVTTANTFTVNVSVNETYIDVCSLEIYNSTNASRLNYSMTKSALTAPAGYLYSCNISVSTADGVSYYYRVFANDTTGVSAVTDSRSIRENAPATLSGAVNVSLNVSGVNPATGFPEGAMPGTALPSSVPHKLDSIIGFAENFTDADRDFEANSTFKWFINNTNQSWGGGNRTTMMVAMIYKDAVGYWHLDENGGTNGYADSSGNGNTGVYGGNPANVSGITRGAVSFDGVNDFVNISGSSFNFSLGDFTISSWLKIFSTPPQNKAFIQKRTNVTLGYELGISDSLDVYTSAASAGKSGPLSLNRWYHISFTRNSGTAFLYINGVLVNSSANTIEASSPNNLYLAYDSVNNRYGNYSLDEVAIYNRSLSASEIKQLYLRTWYDYSPQQFLLHPGYPGEVDNSTQNTTLLLHFDDGAGTTAADSSPFGNRGNVSGAFFTNDSISGSALGFDGVDDHVNISNQYDFKGPFTVEAWVKSNSFTGDRAIISNWRNANIGGVTNHGMFMEFSVATGDPIGDLRFVYRNNGVNVFDFEAAAGVGTVLGTGVWHHLAGVYDPVSGNARLYVDGKLANATSLAGPSFSITGRPILIGTIDGGADGLRRNFSGVIDEVKIVNRSMTAAEIVADYRKGVRFATSDGEAPIAESGVVFQPGRYVENLTVVANTTGYWRFDERSGSAVADISGYGNTGTLKNGVVFVNDSVGGGSGLAFDGVNDFVALPNFDFDNNFTIDAWIKSFNSSYTQIILAGNGEVYFGLLNNTRTLSAYTYGTTPAQWLIGSVVIPYNVWTRVALT